VLKLYIIKILLYRHSLCKAMADVLIDDYLNNLAGQNPRSAVIVGYYLKDFERFANETMGITVSQLVTALKHKKLDVYSILQKYAGELNDHLYHTGKNTAKTINYKVKYAKRLLEYHDVEITQSKFRIKVKIPRNVDPELTPVDKETIRRILNVCDDIRLKTFVLWLRQLPVHRRQTSCRRCLRQRSSS
jgi:hypothetical protein